MDTQKGYTRSYPARRPGRAAAFALVLILVLVGAGYTVSIAGSDTVLTEPVGQRQPIPPEAKEALDASRGDAAASAMLETSRNDDSAGSPRVQGAGSEGVDNQTRSAIEQASRGDAAAQGAVTREQVSGT